MSVHIFLIMGSIIAWNVCGIGNRDKKRALRQSVRYNKLDLLCEVETKKVVVDEEIVNPIWSGNSRLWYVVPSEDLSGGLLFV